MNAGMAYQDRWCPPDHLSGFISHELGVGHSNARNDVDGARILCSAGAWGSHRPAATATGRQVSPPNLLSDLQHHIAYVLSSNWKLRDCNMPMRLTGQAVPCRTSPGCINVRVVQLAAHVDQELPALDADQQLHAAHKGALGAAGGCAEVAEGYH